MRHVVGVADMKVSGAEGDMLVTHALGSCLGLTVFDPVARVAGMLHAMLPVSKLNPEKAASNPHMFVDTGVPALFSAFYAAGGQKKRAVIKAAGCGEPLQAGGMFKVGSRNFTMLKRLLWKNSLLLAESDVGETHSRTLHLDVASGQLMVSTGRVEREL
jgi:chemotaxis protein CheD